MDEQNWSWEEMIARFRSLGGVFENARLGTGAYGRGLFSQQPDQTTRLHIPSSLLIPVHDLEIRDGDLVLRNDAGTGIAERAFFERYQREFSFGAIAGEARRGLALRCELPDVVKDFLTQGSKGKLRFDPVSDQALLDWYTSTRSMDIGGKLRAIMPVLELANHSSSFDLVQLEQSGLSVEGNFEDEILYCYSKSDSWQIFLNWGFVSKEPKAYSVKVEIREPAGKTVHIRSDSQTMTGIDTHQIPATMKDGNAIHVSHVLLGDRENPGLPRWQFRRAIRKHGIKDPDELFDLIMHINRNWFLKLLEITEELPTEQVMDFRKVARHQLETMSYAWGSKPAAKAQ